MRGEGVYWFFSMAISRPRIHNAVDGTRLTLSANGVEGLFEFTQRKMVGAQLVQGKRFGRDDLKRHLDSLIAVASHAP